VRVRQRVILRRSAFSPEKGKVGLFTISAGHQKCIRPEDNAGYERTTATPRDRMTDPTPSPLPPLLPTLLPPPPMHTCICTFTFFRWHLHSHSRVGDFTVMSLRLEMQREQSSVSGSGINARLSRFIRPLLVPYPAFIVSPLIKIRFSRSAIFR
jgi:hypothetical protein